MRLLAVVLFVLVSGCVTSNVEFEKHYVNRVPDKFLPTETVTVLKTGDAQTLYDIYFDDYMLIGSINVREEWDSYDLYRRFGQRAGADIVILSTANEEKVKSQRSYTTPQTSTDYVSGYYGGQFYSGNVTTTSNVTKTYDVTEYFYDIDALFLKKMSPDTKAMWEYRAEDMGDPSGASKFSGLWKNEHYTIRVLAYDNGFAGFIEHTDIDMNKINEPKNMHLGWNKGDIKFFANKDDGAGFYLMSNKSPIYSLFTINKFGYLEIDQGGGDVFSYKKVN